MTQLKELLEIEDLNTVWELSKEKPVLLFKKSTTCPISAASFEQFQSFLNESNEDIGSFFVKVRETRPVSNKIAEKLNIEHQSPQILLIKDGESKWDVSHTKITVKSITEALNNLN